MAPRPSGRWREGGRELAHGHEAPCGPPPPRCDRGHHLQGDAHIARSLNAASCATAREDLSRTGEEQRSLQCASRSSPKRTSKRVRTDEIESPPRKCGNRRTHTKDLQSGDCGRSSRALSRRASKVYRDSWGTLGINSSQSLLRGESAPCSVVEANEQKQRQQQRRQRIRPRCRLFYDISRTWSELTAA